MAPRAPVQSTPYLRQLVSGHIYAWTPQLAVRPDMVPYSKQEADIRIEALKGRIKALKERQAAQHLTDDGVTDAKMVEAQKSAKKLEELDSMVSTLEEMQRVQAEAASKKQEALERGERPEDEDNLTPEEKAAKVRQDWIDADTEVQRIRNFKSKVEVTDYMAENYAVVKDPESSKMGPLKEEAEALRVNRMDELEAANA